MKRIMSTYSHRKAQKDWVTLIEQSVVCWKLEMNVFKIIDITKFWAKYWEEKKKELLDRKIGGDKSKIGSALKYVHIPIV